MPRPKKPFLFKQFQIFDDECAMKVGTDGVLIGAWADAQDRQKILDIGTGIGLIAIMMAQKNPNAKIDAIDIDEAAYRQALKNVAACKWAKNISVHHQKVQDFATSNNRYSYDAIVCNPPFFNNGTASDQWQRQIARHTNALSFEDLLNAVWSLLASDGQFSLILPGLEGLAFQEMARAKGLFLSRCTEVQSKKDKPVERLLMEFQKKEAKWIKEELVIQLEGRNDWTPAYMELTKEFYLKM